MATDYAVKYSTVIDERFKKEALTGPAVNNNYDFLGVQTVKVYSIATSPMTDYQMTGNSRYGTPAELEAPTQELTLSRDRAFTFTIDARATADTNGALEAGQALQRQLDEVVIPEIDAYRLGKLVAGAGKVENAAVTRELLYSDFLTGNAVLNDNKVPLAGRMAFVNSQFYTALKLGKFLTEGDMAQDIKIKGAIGMVDGVTLIQVPQSYLPENTWFIITHPVAMVSPVKLAEYKIHDNPPGINGKLVEGRVYYDAFVLNNKKPAIYVRQGTTA